MPPMQIISNAACHGHGTLLLDQLWAATANGSEVALKLQIICHVHCWTLGGGVRAPTPIAPPPPNSYRIVILSKGL